MISGTFIHEAIDFQRFYPLESGKLLTYLDRLSSETRRRFGPHGYDTDSVTEFYTKDKTLMAFSATHGKGSQIIAYFMVKTGLLDHDRSRLESYGLNLDPETDCIFAPSVADNWQGKGIGSGLFSYVRNELRAAGKKRMILWGGVQANNDIAIRFYDRHGFRVVGEFEYHGCNLDMVLDLI